MRQIMAITTMRSDDALLLFSKIATLSSSVTTTPSASSSSLIMPVAAADVVSSPFAAINSSLIADLFGNNPTAMQTAPIMQAAKPHHVAGYGTTGGLAATFVILNGYTYALLTLLCLILNIITIPVMLQRDIIIPSYIVLTAITLSDMFMALSSLPFNVYFYLFDAYKSFVPFDLCFAQRTFGEVVPAALHTMSIWCTVYLAIHRYREVTSTTAAKRKMSLTGGSANRRDFITVVLHIALVAFFSFFIQIFRFFDTEVIPVRVVAPKDLTLSLLNTTTAPPVISCSMRLKTYITSTIGKKPYFLTFLWSRTICVQMLPCAILIFVNTLLIKILNERIEVRKNMMLHSQNKHNNGSTTTPTPTTTTTTSTTATSTQLMRDNSTVFDDHHRSSIMRDRTPSKGGNIALRNWRLITRMLWLIVLITLLVELPFAAWFIYLCVDITAFQFGLPSYIVNVVSSTLNLLLLLTTPLKFIIYFTMIRPFRDKLSSLQSDFAMKFFTKKSKRRLTRQQSSATAGVTIEPSIGVTEPAVTAAKPPPLITLNSDYNLLVKQPSTAANNQHVEDKETEITPSLSLQHPTKSILAIDAVGDDDEMAPLAKNDIV